MSNELDKKFSNELRGYESTVDAEALWQAVKPPRRQRPMGWLWLLTSLVFLGAGAWWLTHMDIDEAPFAGMNTDTNLIKAEAAVDIGATTDNCNPIQVSPETSTIKEWTIADDQTKGLRPAISFNANTAFAETNTNADETASPTSVSVSKRYIIERQLSSEVSNTRSESLSAKNQLSSLAYAINQNSAFAGKNTSTGLRQAEASGMEARTTIPKEIQASKIASDARITLPITPLEAIVSRTSEEAVSPLFTINYAANDLGNNGKGSPWFAQTDVNYYTLNRQLEGRDSFSFQWADNRRTTEQPLEALSVDLSIGYRLNKQWELRSGVGYTQISTEFGQDNSFSRMDSLEGIKCIVVFPNGTADTIFGLVAVEVTESFKKRTYNSFRQWELPLMASYSFGRNKFYLQAEAGVRLQLHRKWEGEILNAAGRYEDWSKQDVYRGGFGLSLQAGLKVGYELSPRLSVFAGVSARYSPQAFTKKDAPFIERYQLLGGSLGVKRSF